MDSRARRNLNQLNTELQDVQRIMVQNIDDVLQRGEQLSGDYNYSKAIPFLSVGSVFEKKKMVWRQIGEKFLSEAYFCSTEKDFILLICQILYKIVKWHLNNSMIIYQNIAT